MSKPKIMKKKTCANVKIPPGGFQTPCQTARFHYGQGKSPEDIARLLEEPVSRIEACLECKPSIKYSKVNTEALSRDMTLNELVDDILYILNDDPSLIDAILDDCEGSDSKVW
jgi:hypothetical protein